METWLDAGAVAWRTTTGFTAVLTALVLGGWAWRRPAVRGRAIAGGACALLGGSLVLALVEPTRIPTGWITVLQEGRSVRDVQQLYGLATHSGPGFAALVDALSGHDSTTLPVLVRANLCLSVVNTVVFFFLASYVLRSWWASLAFAAAYVANLNTVQAAFSETPAMAWTVHFWLACIAAAAISDRTAPMMLRRLALVALALLAVLAAWLRPEFVVLGVPAVAVGIAHVLDLEEPVQRAVGSAGRFLRSFVTGPLPLFVLVAGGLLVLECVPFPEDLRYVIAAVRPLNLTFLTWLQTLAVFFPVGIIVLFVLGTIHGVRRWFAFFLLPISLLTLLRIYTSASHGPFLDRFRYTTFVTPPVLFLSLYGFRELSAWAAHLGWPPWSKRVAVLLLVATVPAWNPWGPREFFGRRQELPGVPTTQAFLGGNEQTEVRYLLDLIARYPRCVFLAKTPRADSTFDPKSGYRWSAFGRVVRSYREGDDAAGGVEQVAAELAPDSACVLFYRSLDCDLVGLDGCRAETDGRVPLEERVLQNLPYSEVYEYGEHHGEIRLGVYPVVVQDRSAVAAADGRSG